MHSSDGNSNGGDGDSKPVDNYATKVVWEEYAFEYMYAAAKKAMPNEIGGLGLVRARENGELYIYESIVLPQRVGPASTDLDKGGMIAWMAANPDKVSDCKVWWHSHASFGVFLSGTDQACITELLKIMPWLITPVVNARNDLYLQLHLKEPARHSFNVEYDVESAIARAERACDLDVPACIIKEPERVFEFKGFGKRHRVTQDAAVRKVQAPDGDLQSGDLWKDRYGNNWGGWDRELDQLGAFQDGYVQPDPV